jgi:hypothetical protein
MALEITGVSGTETPASKTHCDGRTQVWVDCIHLNAPSVYVGDFCRAPTHKTKPNRYL